MSLHVNTLTFQALVAICQVMDKALDLSSALRDILRILSERLSMQRATVTLYESGTGQLAINASHGLSREEKDRGIYRLDEGVTGRIFRTAEPYVVPDIDKEPLFLDKTGSRKIAKGQISFIGVPILLHGEPIGVLNVDRLFADEVGFDEDVAFLQIVATLMGQFISLNEKVREREAVLKQENVSLKSQIARENKGPYIVGRSMAMVEVQRQMEKVAPTRATVMLLGESGVGKTLIARIIHQLSDRKKHSFIKVNCASIPENLLESELFGYEKGAFTGATSTRPGRFEEADKGTIFLDEIGELPLSLQSKLLRVLQDREFERLGSNRTRRTDVRILAATNRDLGELVEAGGFRLDLYYRLSVFPMNVPALRERKEDIPGLINHFISKMNEEYARSLTFSEEALDTLIGYDWPGNVREMENLIERLVIMSDTDRIDSDFLYTQLGHSEPGPDFGIPRHASTTSSSPQEEAIHRNDERWSGSLKELEKRQLINALERNGWIQYKAAEELGLTPRQMGYRVKKFRLEGRVAEGRASVRRERSY